LVINGFGYVECYLLVTVVVGDNRHRDQVIGRRQPVSDSHTFDIAGTVEEPLYAGQHEE
jgi:hypothetical protein